MNWFEEWFDSPLYEKLYANRDEQEARRLIDLLLEKLPLSHDSYILDLGCGRGRHSLSLAREGYRVMGIDLSEQAIGKARQKADKEGLNNVEFKVRDMRNPLPVQFNAVVNLFTSFGYFQEDEENAKVLDSVKSMLKPGGIFILDYLNAPLVKSSYVPEEEGKFQEIDYHIHRYISNGAIYKKIVFDGEKLENKQSYTERVKLYDLEWFRKELKIRNLVIDKVFGDYSGNDYEEKSSPRLLLISHLELG